MRDAVSRASISLLGVLQEVAQDLVDRRVVPVLLLTVLLTVLLELLLLQEMLPPRGVPARVAEITLQRGAG